MYCIESKLVSYVINKYTRYFSGLVDNYSLILSTFIQEINFKYNYNGNQYIMSHNPYAPYS